MDSPSTLSSNFKAASRVTLPTEEQDNDSDMMPKHSECGTMTKGLNGAYRVLRDFLLSVHYNGSEKLSKERFDELANCLESVSSFGEGQSFNVSSMFQNQSLSGGIAEAAGVGLLQAFGVNVKSMKNKNARESLATVKDRPIEEEQEENEEKDKVEKLVLIQPNLDHQKIMLDHDFNAWQYCSKENDHDFSASVPLVLTIFVQPMNMVEYYHLNEGKLMDWTKAIAGKYLDNSYHNWAHAVDVTQTMFHMMHHTDTSTFLMNQDTLALYCAALAHDVGHVGLTNPFLVGRGHALAINYNDKAPLENMHGSLCFQTLAEHNFLEGSLKEGKVWTGYRNFRGKVISAILATDMGQHMGFVDRFSSRVNSESPFLGNVKQNEERKDASKTDRRLLLEAFLHTADLGHNTRQFNINKWGVLRLEEEWFKQGDLERDLGVPISPNNDRHKDSVASTQPFFFEAFIRPLLDPWRFIMTQSGFDVFQANLDTNKSTWDEAVKKFGKLSAPKLLALMDGEEVKEWIVKVSEGKIRDDDARQYATAFVDAGICKISQLSTFSMDDFDGPIGDNILEVHHRRLIRRQVQLIAEPEA